MQSTRLLRNMSASKLHHLLFSITKLLLTFANFSSHFKDLVQTAVVAKELYSTH